MQDEKNELRDEKQKLKIEKERIEQQLKAAINTSQPCFLPNPPTLSQAQTPGSKLVPYTTYPGFAMWQFMPPAAVDTSQDHVLRPPVAQKSCPLCSLFFLSDIMVLSHSGDNPMQTCIVIYASCD